MMKTAGKELKIREKPGKLHFWNT